MVDTIFREPTNEEKKDFKPLLQVTPRKQFLKQLAETQQEFLQDKLPYCQKCAMIHFDDKVENMQKELSRTAKTEKERISKILSTDFGNLKRFGGIQFFKVAARPHEIRTPMINRHGIKSTYVEGFIVDFKCARGHGDSVTVQAHDWENWKQSTGLAKEQWIKEAVLPQDVVVTHPAGAAPSQSQSQSQPQNK